MLPIIEDAIPVRFVAGDIDSKRDAFLLMFRLVIGNALATGHHLKDIADDIGISISKLADWIAGDVGDHEVDAMSCACLSFAHGLGLDLEPVEG
jgi:hypothetical protein